LNPLFINPFNHQKNYTGYDQQQVYQENLNKPGFYRAREKIKIVIIVQKKQERNRQDGKR
jgi:hypothetical protein